MIRFIYLGWSKDGDLRSESFSSLIAPKLISLLTSFLTFIHVSSELDKAVSIMDLHRSLISNLPEWYYTYTMYHQTDP